MSAIPWTVRELVLSRDGHRCARCDASVLNIPSSIQHRKPRQMGGTRDVRSFDSRNLVLLCGTGTTGCHGEVESYRTLSYDTGWLLRSYDDLDRPLISKDGREVHLIPEEPFRYDVVTAASILAAEAMA